MLLLGDDKHELHKQLCEAVKPTIVGGVLRSVKYEDSESFYKRYLHDFARLVHRSTHTKENETKEYEVFSILHQSLIAVTPYLCINTASVKCFGCVSLWW